MAITHETRPEESASEKGAAAFRFPQEGGVSLPTAPPWIELKPTVMECWIAPRWSGKGTHTSENFAPGGCVFQLGLWPDALALYVSKTRRNLLVRGDSTAAAVLDLTDDEPVHVSLTLTGGQPTLVVGGDTELSFITPRKKKTPRFKVTDPWPVLLGTDEEGQAFEGILSGFRIWNEELSEKELERAAALGWDSLDLPLPPHLQIDPRKLALYQRAEGKRSKLSFHLEPQGCWVQEEKELRDGPRLKKLPNNPGQHHALVDSPRYFTTVRDPDSFELLLVDDGDSRTKLEPAGNGRPNCYVGKAGGESLTVSIEPELEGLEIEGGDAAGAYTRPFVRPPEKHKQEFGEVWGHRPANLEQFCTKGWDVTKIDPFNTDSTRIVRDVFALPAGDSTRYRLTNNLTIPYGFLSSSQATGESALLSTFTTSEQQIRDSFSTGTSEGISGGAILSVSLENNEEVNRLSDEAYEQKVVYSFHRYLLTSHLIVLDKSNGDLSAERSGDRVEGFKPDVKRLVLRKIQPEKLIREYGTHYAYGLRFGAKGYMKNTYASEKVVKLLEQGTKMSWGADLQAKKKLPKGLDVSASASYKEEEASSHAQQLADELGEEQGEWRVVGTTTTGGQLQYDEKHPIPIFLDLRPLSELLGPPFFDDYETVVDARDRLAAAIDEYTEGGTVRTQPTVRFFRVSLKSASLSVASLTATVHLQLSQGSEPSHEKQLGRVSSGAPTEFKPATQIFSVAHGEDSLTGVVRLVFGPKNKAEPIEFETTCSVNDVVLGKAVDVPVQLAGEVAYDMNSGFARVGPDKLTCDLSLSVEEIDLNEGL